MKQLARLCLLLSITLSTPVIAEPQIDPKAALDDVTEFDALTAKLVHAQDFSALEEMKAEILKTNARFKNGKSKLPRYYELLTDCDADFVQCDRFTTAWSSAQPESISLRIIRAKIALQKAWLARGSGFAPGKSEPTWNSFFEKLKAAETALRVADEKQVKDPEYFATRYSIEAPLYEGSTKKLIEIFTLGTDLNRTYEGLYEQRATYLLPRWYGEKGDLERFADEAVSMTKESMGAGMLVYIAQIARQFIEEDFYLKTSFTWEEIKAGYRDLIQRYPSSRELLGSYLIEAWYAEDRESAREIISKLGRSYDPSLKGINGAGYLNLLRWADTQPSPTPLIDAVRKGDKDGVMKALSAGADPNIENIEGAYAHHYAVAYQPELLPLLLDKGAKPNLGLYRQRVTLDLAVIRGDLTSVKLLLEHKAFGVEAVQIAVAEDYLQILRELLKVEGPRDYRQSQLTPLMAAVYTDRAAAARLILEARPDQVNVVSLPSKMSALHLAVIRKNEPFVKLLLEAGANPNLNVPGTGTPFDLARESPPELHELMKKYAPEAPKVANTTASNLPGIQLGEGKLLEKDSLRGTITAALQSSNFEELEKIHKEVSTPASRFIDGQPKLSAFYDLLTVCPESVESCKSAFEAWSAAKPGSAVSHVALSRLALLPFELEVKRSGSPSRAQLEELTPTLMAGWDRFEIARKLPDADANAFAVGLSLAEALRKDDEQKSAILTAGIAKDPSYEPLWFAAVQGLLNKANFDSIEPLALQAATASKAAIGDGMYARIASYVARRVSPEQYQSLGFSWPRIQTGFEDLLKKDPQIKRFAGQYLLMAAREKDRKAALAAVRALQNRFDPSIADLFPNGESGFDDLVTWARGDGITAHNLVSAIRDGNQEAAETALSQGELIDTPDTDGWTPLLAALKFNRSLTSWVLSHGANPNQGSKHGMPIHLAAEIGDLTLFRSLIDAGASEDISGDSGSPLTIAVLNGRKEIVQYLIRSPNVTVTQSRNGRTVFHVAIEKNRLPELELLLRSPKVDPNEPTHPEPRPLSFAVQQDNIEAAKLLLSFGANPRDRKSGKSALDLAKERGNKEMITALQTVHRRSPIDTPLNPGDQNVSAIVSSGKINQLSDPSLFSGITGEINGRTALQVAVEAGNIEATRKLLAQPFYQDQVSMVLKGIEPVLVTAVRLRNVEMSALLLSFDANPLIAYRNEESAAQLAQRLGDQELFKVLDERMRKYRTTLDDDGQIVRLE